MSQLKDRYRELVVGEVSCFDRVVINGTLTEICHKGAMAQYLLSRGQRILDLPRVFEPLQNCGRQALEPWNVRSFQLSKVLKPGTETSLAPKLRNGCALGPPGPLQPAPID